MTHLIIKWNAPTFGHVPLLYIDIEPALFWSATGGQIDVELLISFQLPQNWDRLDAFEGDEYARIVVPLASGRIANVYAHAHPVK